MKSVITKDDILSPEILKEQYTKKMQRILFLSCASLLIIIILISSVTNAFPDKASLAKTIRGNDPLLREIIPLNEADNVQTSLDYDLEDDKSLYDLNNAGNVNVFLLEIFDKGGYDLTDFEDPEVSQDLKLPAIFQEGSKSGTPLLNGFGTTAVTTNSTVEVKGEPKENRKFHNFKIRLKDSASRYNGQSIINLKKAYGKQCKVEEKFAFDLFAGLDEMMSLRTEFVHLYIKNAASPSPDYESYGLYMLVEQPDDNYFINRSLDSNANMYQAENFDFTVTESLVNVDDPIYKKKDFEQILDIKQGKSHTALLEMVHAVNDESQDIDDIIDQHLNRDNLFTFMAMNVILGNEDMTTNGFMLYKPVLSSVWFVLPSNMSETMLSCLDDNHYQVMNTGLSQFSGNLLYERILSKPENVDELCAKIDSLIQRIDKETVTSLTNQYIPVLTKYLKVNPDRGMLKTTPEKVINGVQNFYSVMQKNVSEFKNNMDIPEKVTLEKIEMLDSNVILKWQPPSSVFTLPNTTYSVQVSSSPNFNDIVYEKDSIALTYFELPKSELPQNISHFYWRITSKSTNGKTAGSTNTIEINENDSIIYGASSFDLKN